MALRLVIFDCDGTLVDSQHGIVRSMQQAFLSFGLIAPQPEAVKRVVGLSLDHAVSTLAPELGSSDVSQVAGTYKALFSELRRGGDLPEPAFPGVLDAVAELERRGYLLGVATGKSRRGLFAVVERLGLDGRFVTLQTADDVMAGKPAPDMCLQACAEAGVDPADAVVIGDTTYDIAMALSARAGAIGVAWGYHPPAELQAEGARSIARHGRDLPGLVDDHFSEAAS
ncbi:MAG: HAD-IA family hydrolase [Minwuia sp.]|uniref:HAD-IA family hydrolase n=1 Tax=Minwuia sp. TaxID=2493630 RepID=UPI003A874806